MSQPSESIQPDLTTPAGRLAHLKRRQAERDAGIVKPADPRLRESLGWWIARQVRREQAEGR